MGFVLQKCPFDVAEAMHVSCFYLPQGRLSGVFVLPGLISRIDCQFKTKNVLL